MVNGWDYSLIGDIFDFKNGLNKGKEFFGYGTPIVNYTDVYKKRSLDKADIKGKVSLDVDEIRRFEAKKYDVFFTRTSETPEEVGMSSVLLEDVEGCVFSGFVLRARPKNNMLYPKYCKYCFSTPEIRSAIILGCTYTTRALTNGKQLSAISIPIPPLVEQERIAEALSDVDSMISSLEKLIEKKKAVKQGTMQELLTGKKRLPGFNKEWIEKKIEDIAEVSRGRVISHIEISKNIGGKYPVYSSQTTNNGIMGYLRTFDFDGDYVTWTTDGVNAGTVFYRNGKFNCTNVCGTLKIKKDNANFLARRLGVETTNYVATNLANPKLMNDVMKKITITLPSSIEEQTAIASILSDMDNEIEALEQKLAKTRQLKQGMMQQLLTGKIRLV